MIFGINKTT